jgi:hypothetical protein
MKDLKELSPLDAAKKVFLMKLVDEFKDFVADSFDEGLHEDFEDHMEFMQACLTTFIEIKNDEITGE